MPKTSKIDREVEESVKKFQEANRKYLERKLVKLENRAEIILDLIAEVENRKIS